ncbi:hypothetical protein LTS08_000906 [Lithohypha guttulata]|uniref:uncharacterized protein n=1 Tax=Lithohypha guttulata TaxID=1690604 RepID=UPI002DE0944E|nr:hypothetical protein LTR51_006478 [Lithohypha guttulata]KAK5106783.1 hypothetical protein LTS08_000906 [Lithohypha guttulata]
MSIINANPVLQKYYASLESRIGYRLFLNGTRHYGYYETKDSFPLPVGQALRRMEEQLFLGLQCPPGAKLLDAGCGIGHVAIYMAKRGNYRIEAIDVVARHAEKAKRNIAAAGLKDVVVAKHGDYHHLEDYEDNSLDGIYTMETLVHSTDPLSVLKEFHRIPKPGGRLAMNEYDHEDLDKAAKDLSDAMRKSFDRDTLPKLVKQAGFEEMELKDFSKHIQPMLWLFYIFAIIPYTIFRLLGIETYFVNTIAGVEGWRGRDLWRYTQVTAKKRG